MLTLDVHPLRETKPNTQLIFTCAGAWLDHAKAHLRDRSGDVRATLPAVARSGVCCEAFVADADRRTILGVLFLAREDLTTGRTGVWRPTAQTLGRLPEQLLAPLGSGRSGGHQSST